MESGLAVKLYPNSASQELKIKNPKNIMFVDSFFYKILTITIISNKIKLYYYVVAVNNMNQFTQWPSGE